VKKPSIYLLFITVVLCLSVMLSACAGQTGADYTDNTKEIQNGDSTMSTDGWDLSAPDIDIIKAPERWCDMSRKKTIKESNITPGMYYEMIKEVYTKEKQLEKVQMKPSR
jgi:hypothetical protein